MIRLFTLAIFLVLTSVPQLVQGGFLTKGEWRLSLDYWGFTGEENLGLTSASKGFGGTIAKRWGQGRLSLLGEVGGCFVQGTETLVDGASTQQLDINGLISGIRLGARINIGSLYGLVVGMGEYHYLKLPSDGTYASLVQTDTGTGFGYMIGGGIQRKWVSVAIFLRAAIAI